MDPTTDLKHLRRQVESDFLAYAAGYIPPDPSTTLGQPWSKERVASEVKRMLDLIVEPYSVQYFSGDDLVPPDQRLIGDRAAYAVAEDGDYVLLFDIDARDFVLAAWHSDGRLTAWGIRGDATSTFMAR